MKAAYFVHDLNDPAVHRRVRMLQDGGASVVLLGFCRGSPPTTIDGVAPLVIGRTESAHLLQRAIAVLSGLLALPRWRRALAGVDTIIARQLETLVLAVIARRIHAPAAPVIFECLDIHRLMGTPGPVGWLLRGIEGQLLTRAQGLMVSSPDFVRAYFAPVHFARGRAACLPTILVENKVLAVEWDAGWTDAAEASALRPAGPPWRIGWCGMIRCTRSLRLLADVAAARPGTVEIVIHGRVAPALQPMLDSVLTTTPGVRFAGPYDRRHDLARIYGGMHFAWAVDFYEDGGNSDWLLPNRLYEAALFGAIPIARAAVATGAWLACRGVGALLDGDPAEALDAFVTELDAARHADLAQALATLSDDAFIHSRADCANLVERLTAARPVSSQSARARMVRFFGNPQ